jgi:hypothetical protein
MYDNLDESQLNYSAPEIIEHPELGLAEVAERGEECQFNNFVDLLELQMLSLARVKLAFVLIFSPNLILIHKLQILAGFPQQHNANYCGPNNNI